MMGARDDGGESLTTNGNHVSEEEMVEHYYGEDASAARVERHLKACAQCSREFAALQRDLGGVKALTTPARGETYGEQVWKAIRSSLPVYEREKRRWPSLGFRRPLVLAATAALLVVAAFVAGRVWQKQQPAQTTAVTGTAERGRERVVVWVLGDHLDRSERLLVELNHANSKDAAAAGPIQNEARELLAANRLVRQSATQSATGSTDPAMDAALDRLERLLVEVANEPDGLSEADLQRLRQQMNTDGLLFDVRVLRSRVMQQQPNAAPGSAASGSKGVSI